jgi:hypothetical protein
MENNKNKIKECKLVFNAGCARSLLRVGCTMVDIKQSRENPDKSVFVFKNDELFQTEFERLNKEIADAKAAHEAE